MKYEHESFQDIVFWIALAPLNAVGVLASLSLLLNDLLKTGEEKVMEIIEIKYPEDNDASDYVKHVVAKREHEDGLINARTGFFLVASGLLAVVITSADKVGFPWSREVAVSFAVLLSVIWYLLGVRHSVLMRFYHDRIIAGTPSGEHYDRSAGELPLESQFAREVRKMKKEEFPRAWIGELPLIGHNKRKGESRFSATRIAMVYLPLMIGLLWSITLLVLVSSATLNWLDDDVASATSQEEMPKSPSPGNDVSPADRTPEAGN